MTELQLAIGHLKETISVGNVLLDKMEKQQKDKDLEILNEFVVPVFPPWFFVEKDNSFANCFVIGLDNPISWRELPENAKGRSCYSKLDLRQIITGLQILLGESQ